MDPNCITGLDCLPEDIRGCVLTIGNFDGVHRGHQRILSCARALAAQRESAVVALTFEPPPDLVVRPDDVPQRITPSAAKCGFLRESGADWVVTMTTERALLSLLPEEFIHEIVRPRLAPTHIVEGPNFFFGRDRRGTLAVLRELGKAAGFTVHTVEPVTLSLGGEAAPVSSTLIRRFLASGRIEEATCCLGREFTLYGTVVGGYRRGRLLDYPTANLAPGEQITPGDGIYAGRASLQGRTYPAAVSLGCNPTFGPTERTIEAFLLDAEGDFYDESMAVSFVRRLRDQKKFPDAEALRRQIAEDVRQVRDICG